MLKFAAIAGVTLLASPALAAVGPWQDLAPGVRARLISSDAIQPADGTTRVALELDMPINTKTYWRIPGESGLPPQLDFSGSQGLGEARILWPYPEIDRAGGYLDYVYHGHVVVPVALKAIDTTKAIVTLDAILGVCSDVCIPAQAKFVLPVTYARTDDVATLAIGLAIAQTPDTWSGPTAPVDHVSIAPGGLLLSDLDPAIDPQSLIADIGDPAYVFATPQKSPDGRGWFVKSLGDMDARGLVGRTIQLTFMSRQIPYAVSLPIRAG